MNSIFLKNLFQIKTSIATVLLIANYAVAGLIGISFDNSTPFNTTQVSSFTTTGSDMVGMEITAIFENGLSETATWQSNFNKFGKATGTNWELNLFGDSFQFQWFLQSSGASIDRLLLDGAPGNTFFDVQNIGSGTPLSFLGHPFEQKYLKHDLNYNVIYNRPLGVSGNNPIGDLFVGMEIEFSTSFINNQMRFKADTDNAFFQNDILPIDTPPSPAPIPEPTTTALMVFGLLAIFGLRFRKKSN